MKNWLIGALSGVIVCITSIGNVRADEKEDAAAAASIAKDKATAATAMQTANADLTKAQIANLTSQQTYYQSLIPDPDKYKIADPKAPKLNASTSKLAYSNAATIAARIVTIIRTATPQKCCAKDDDKTNPISILLTDSSAQSLLTQSASTQSVLSLAKKKLIAQRALLKASTEAKDEKAAAPAIGVISDVVQLAASFALILKPSRAFDSVSHQAVADSAFQSEVVGKLAASECITVHNPSAITNLSTVPVPGVADKNAPIELTLAAELTQEIGLSRDEIKTANEKIATMAKPVGNETKKEKADRAATLKKFTDQVATFSALVDECDKGLTALYLIDAQGNSPLDLAVRGGILRKTLTGRSVYTLALRTISSDADIIAKDCLFCEYKVMVGTTTAVSWQLTDQTGIITSAGMDSEHTALAKISLPN